MQDARGDSLSGGGRLVGAALRADQALRREQPSLRVLACLLLAGPLLLLALLASGASLKLAILAGVTGGCCVLWTVRSLPVHFAPLLALLIYNLFLLEPGQRLMQGLSMDVFWWMLGSLMLALAAWETGLIGVLMLPRSPTMAFLSRLLAGLTGLYGTRAAALLAPFAKRDRRTGRFAYHIGRLVCLPSHIMNFYMLGLLSPVVADRLSLMNWAAMMLVPGVVLAGLASCVPGAHGSAGAAPPVEGQPRQIRLSASQWLAGVALLLGWLGAGLSHWHGLAPGVWCLYLGLMVVAAGLLPVKKISEDIDWPLLLAIGTCIGLSQTFTQQLRGPLAALIGAGGHPPHPLVLAAILLALAGGAYRYAGLLRGGLIVLPLAGMLASTQAHGAAGWMLIVLLTLHWLDISSAAPARGRRLRNTVGVAGLGVIALTGAVWFRLGIL